MIEWLLRVDPARPLIYADEGTWTYGQALAQVEGRIEKSPRLVRPSLTPESILDVLAAISGGGATVIGPESSIVDPGNADLVVFTSGTSGDPRGVRLTRRNLEAAARASSQHLGHGPDDDWLLAMPLHHVGGLTIVVRQVFSGGSITLLPGFDVRTVASAMRGRVTMVSVVPTMLRRILDHDSRPYEGMRAVLVGGGPIPDGLLEEASAAGLPVLPTYGMTETFGQIATLRPDAPLEHLVHPLPGVDIRVDDQCRISVRGDQVSPGYVNEPDRSSDWLITSDLGVMHEDGALRVLGRADNVIVTGGENVNPESIEVEIQAHPEVHEAVVVGIPDDEWGMVVGCVFVGDVLVEELVEWSADKLAGPRRPKRWAKVERLPRLSIEKPDRSAAAEFF